MEEAPANIAFPVNRNGRPSTIGVMIDRMASALTLEREAMTLKKTDDFAGRKLWEARGHTSTRIVEVLISS